MSSHEPDTPDDPVQPGSDRNFGFTIGGILAAIGLYQFYIGFPAAPWVASVGLALGAIGIFAPARLHRLNVAWTQLGVLLGKVVTPVVLFAVYAITIVPIGLAMRVSGKNLLRRRYDESLKTYWIDRDPPGPLPESLKDQF